MNNTEAQGFIKLRAAELSDAAALIALDALVSGVKKSDYWEERINSFTSKPGRHLIVAESDGKIQNAQILGFILGEIRAWEFGSRPCGWIFALGVDPEFRVQGIGQKLFTAICNAFRADGANAVRTMIARHDQLNMSFFRAQGMMGGPFIELEKSL